MCCYTRKATNSIPNKSKGYSLNEWIETVDYELLLKKCDFFEISKMLDQFRILNKLVLNEGQCNLLNNRD